MLAPENLSELLEEIDATALLESRAQRAPDWQAEAEAWERLTEVCWRRRVFDPDGDIGLTHPVTSQS